MSWQPFPVGYLPECVRAFVAEAAEALGCEAAHVALPLLTCLGAAIGNSRVIRLKKNWSEPPLLWTLTAGEVGTQISPASELATAFTRKHQERLLSEYRRAGAEKGNGQAPAGRLGRLVVWDAPLETLLVRLSAAPRGLLWLGDEGGLPACSDGQRKRELRQYLAMHRAGSLTVDRRYGEHDLLHIPRAFVAMAGGIQSEQLSRMLKGPPAASAVVARLLLAMPPRQPRLWSEKEISGPTVARLQTVFEKLWALEGAQGEGGCEPVELKLEDEARVIWLRFFAGHAQQLAGRTGRLAAAWAKLEGYCPRLALIVRLVQWADDSRTCGQADTVDAISMNQAARLTKWFAQETERIYRYFAVDEPCDDDPDRQVLQWIEDEGGTTTARKLMVKFRRLFPTAAAAKNALRQFSNVGFLIADLYIPSGDRGRPVVTYRLNENQRLAPPSAEAARPIANAFGDGCTIVAST